MRLPITYKINLSVVGNINYQLHIHYDYNEEAEQYATNISFVKSTKTLDIELFTYSIENIRIIFTDLINGKYKETYLESYYGLGESKTNNQKALFIKDNDNIIVRIITDDLFNDEMTIQEEIKISKDMISLLISYFNFNDIVDDDTEVFDELESLGFIF